MTRISLKSAANKISIHAPPRGATRLRISIHAPPRGATAVSATMSRLRDFNSRPSARGDHGCLAGAVQQGISIHAPPRGATRSSAPSVAGRTSNFNSRPSARGDPDRTALCSAHPYFNSRPSARGDANLVEDYAFRTISIHAPPRGATLMRP